MKYIVTEIQKFDTGAISTPSYAYDDRNSAEAKFYSILASAAVSQLPTHACIMYAEDGVPIMNKAYYHVPEVEPEPDEEPSEG
jgi:hypothetical protein